MKTAIFEVEDWEADTFSALDSEDHDVECVPVPLTAENASEFADAMPRSFPRLFILL